MSDIEITEDEAQVAAEQRGEDLVDRTPASTEADLRERLTLHQYADLRAVLGWPRECDLDPDTPYPSAAAQRLADALWPPL